VDRLRQNFEDNQVPVSLRHKYATKLAEWYEFLGQELEAEMSRDISHDNAISIKAD
jgi:Mor family transcriptional regulator